MPAALVAACLVVLATVMAPPTYRASGSIVLLNPAPHPVDPVTKATQAINNPYVRLNDLSVVVDILKRVMQSEPVERILVGRGFVGKYEVAANIDFYSGPIIDIAAEAGDPQVAIANVDLVMDEAEVQLTKLQTDQSVTDDELIRTQVVVKPTRATTVFSSTLRRMVAVGVLGGGLVLGAGLLGETLARRRRDREFEPEPAERQPQTDRPESAASLRPMESPRGHADPRPVLVAARPHIVAASEVPPSTPTEPKPSATTTDRPIWPRAASSDGVAASMIGPRAAAQQVSADRPASASGGQTWTWTPQ